MTAIKLIEVPSAEGHIGATRAVAQSTSFTSELTGTIPRTLEMLVTHMICTAPYLPAQPLSTNLVQPTNKTKNRMDKSTKNVGAPPS